jgi:UDP-N-acetylglucosamine acyltransferase
MSIHPSAVVDPRAQIDPSCEIGPLCIIGPHVQIGARTRLIGQVVVQNRTQLGCDNVVHPFACLGGAPQDLKYQGEPARLCIGDRNVIRESTTLNIGTANGNMQTRIGNDNLLMAYCHIAHDCEVHDRIVVANGVALAGHVQLFDDSIVGGLAAVHQFCRIGRLSFVGGGAMVAQDVPPFCIAQGDRAAVAGLNVVGLRRAGWPKADIQALHAALRQIYSPDRPRTQAVQDVLQFASQPPTAELCEFIIQAPRGVCGARHRLGDSPRDGAPDG